MNECMAREGPESPGSPGQCKEEGARAGAWPRGRRREPPPWGMGDGVAGERGPDSLQEEEVEEAKRLVSPSSRGVGSSWQAGAFLPASATTSLRGTVRADGEGSGRKASVKVAKRVTLRHFSPAEGDLEAVR